MTQAGAELAVRISSERLTVAVASTAVSRALAGVVSFGIAIITARLLGVEGRGVFYSLVVLAQFTAQLATLGLQSSNVVGHARGLADTSSFILGSAVAALLSGIVSSVVVLAVAQLWHLNGVAVIGEPPVLMGVLLFGICSAFLQISIPLLFADSRYGWANGMTLVAPVAALGFVAVACLLSRSPPLVFMWNACGSLVAALLLIAWAWTSNHNASVSRGLRAVMDGSTFAGRTFVVTGAAWLAQRFLVFVLADVSTAREVGLYSVAIQVADALMIIPAAVASILFPRLLRHDGEDRHLFRRALTQTLAVMALVCLLVGIASPFLVTAIFGPAFRGAIPVVLAMLPAVILLSAITVISQQIAAAGQPMRAAAVWLLGTACAVAACVVLGRTLGAVGASLAHVVGFVVVLISLERLRRERAG